MANSAFSSQPSWVGVGVKVRVRVRVRDRVRMWVWVRVTDVPVRGRGADLVDEMDEAVAAQVRLLPQG